MKYVARVRQVLRTGIHKMGSVRDGEIVAGEELPLPDRVEVELDEASRHCMLYRYTDTGEFCGDTWHQCLQDAFDQAEREYGLRKSDFTPIEA